MEQAPSTTLTPGPEIGVHFSCGTSLLEGVIDPLGVERLTEPLEARRDIETKEFINPCRDIHDHLPGDHLNLILSGRICKEVFSLSDRHCALALILIFAFFDGLGGMALVAASWGIWHVIAGLALATFWSRRGNAVEVGRG